MHKIKPIYDLDTDSFLHYIHETSYLKSDWFYESLLYFEKSQYPKDYIFSRDLNDTNNIENFIIGPPPEVLKVSPRYCMSCQSYCQNIICNECYELNIPPLKEINLNKIYCSYSDYYLYFMK